jgi:ferrochelatase
MKIETLVNLTGAELLNRPYISEVVHFTDNPEEVNRGSCFFVKKISDIPRAVKNGAYAIVSDKDLDVLDREIAWLKVDDYEKAIFNIFKYENLKHEIILCDKISLMFITAMNQDKRVVVINSPEDLFRGINLREKFIFTSNKEYKKIFANVKELKRAKLPLEMVTLFKTAYKDNILNFPFVYAKSFSKVLKFFENNNIKYTLDFEIPRFKPIFINHNFEEVEYGKSEKVVITGIENDEVFFDELNYIVENTKHAKTVFINFQNRKLLEKPFNFAVMVSTSFTPKENTQKGLFDD